MKLDAKNIIQYLLLTFKEHLNTNRCLFFQSDRGSAVLFRNNLGGIVTHVYNRYAVVEKIFKYASHLGYENDETLQNLS